jgi:hypothetical protein
MPHLEITTEKEMRTGYVSREWEERYRAEREAAKSNPSVIPTSIELDAPVTFNARWDLFVPPVARAVRREGEIEIDGKFSEKAWASAEAITDFKHRAEGDPQVKTVARFLWDDDYLYVAAWMEESSPDHMKSDAEPPIPLTWDDDDFELFFDPEQSQGNYVRLFQNVAGTRFNSLPRNVENRYFQSDYKSAIEKDDDYWTLEMKIPWSDIDVKTPPRAGDKWSLNIGRHRPQSEPSEMFWAGGLYNPSHYGILVFE